MDTNKVRLAQDVKNRSWELALHPCTSSSLLLLDGVANFLKQMEAERGDALVIARQASFTILC